MSELYLSKIITKNELTYLYLTCSIEVLEEMKEKKDIINFTVLRQRDSCTDSAAQKRFILNIIHDLGLSVTKQHADSAEMSAYSIIYYKHYFLVNHWMNVIIDEKVRQWFRAANNVIQKTKTHPDYLRESYIQRNKLFSAHMNECLPYIKNYLNNQKINFFQLLEQPKLPNNNCFISNMSKPNGFTHYQYQDLLFQKSYLLKYGLAYAYDYQNLYDKLTQLVPELIQRKSVNILSIGCGSGVDSVSAEWVFYKKHKIIFNYAGIDSVKWHDRFHENIDYVQYYDYGIDRISVETIKNADIIIFPRSITDIPIQSLKNFAKKVTEIDKEVYFLFGLVSAFSSENSQLTDGKNNIKILTNEFIINKLKLNDIEESKPSIEDILDSELFDVHKKCYKNKECHRHNECDFMSVKNINNYGYHHILRVIPNE